MSELISAGLLMYTRKNNELKFFLVHPGGPFFKNKDNGYWSIPKGLSEEGEDLLAAAMREFEEETGIKPEGKFISLGTIKQKSGKTVHGWAFECDNDNPIEITCNTFEIEWPPKSGKIQKFPEADMGEFFSEDEAKKKINSAQIEFIERLKDYIKIK